MGNTTRCPKCNKFGDANLNNYCKRCDLDMFKDEVHTLCGGSVKLLNLAMLEVGAKSVLQIKAEDRHRVLNIIKKRKPKSRRDNLVQATAPLESSGGAFIEPEAYAAEKGVPSIEY